MVKRCPGLPQEGRSPLSCGLQGVVLPGSTRGSRTAASQGGTEEQPPSQGPGLVPRDETGRDPRTQGSSQERHTREGSAGPAPKAPASLLRCVPVTRNRASTKPLQPRGASGMGRLRVAWHPGLAGDQAF